MSIPVLDLKLAEDPQRRGELLQQLQDVLFNIGFLYISNHGVPEKTISDLAKRAPALFGISDESKLKLSKMNSPHFLGYTGLAEEVTQGKGDQREQFDFATELPVIYHEGETGESGGRDFSKLYWRLRGPNQWPNEDEVPGLKEAVLRYHEALSDLSYRFVHLVEEAFGIPVGTFDQFFGKAPPNGTSPSLLLERTFLEPAHRLKIAKYHPETPEGQGQGIGAHKDSSGWLTFLYQIGSDKCLEVLDKNGNWLSAAPITGTFVVNFGNAFEAVTEGAVKATIHRVRSPKDRDRYSLGLFMGLPLDLKLSEIKALIPEKVRSMRRKENGQVAVEANLPAFLDPRWDSLGESMLRKWIRTFPHVGEKWYGPKVVEYYTQ